MSGEKSTTARPAGLVAYFVLAYAITWSLSSLATEGLLPFRVPAAVATLSSMLLHWGPALAAIIVMSLVGGRAGLRQMLSRFREWRVGIHWYLFIFLFPLISRLIAVGLDVVLGGTPPEFFNAPGMGVQAGVSAVVLLVPVFVVILFQAGIAEEIGWRGFALPGVQARYSALTSSLILGVLWGLWHFHPQNWSHLAPIAFWYILAVVSFTVIITWVYNNTEGSLLLAVLFHACSNLSDWIVPIVPFVSGTGAARAFVIHDVITLTVAAAIVIAFGPKRLSRTTSS